MAGGPARLCNLKAVRWAELLRAGPGSLITPHFLSSHASQADSWQGTSFWFWLSSLPHPVSLCCANRKNSTLGWRRMEQNVPGAAAACVWGFCLAIAEHHNRDGLADGFSDALIERCVLQIGLWARAGGEPRARLTLLGFFAFFFSFGSGI